MKILFITDFIMSANYSGGFISDYLNDLTFHGLKQIYGKDITALIPPIHMYKENKGESMDYLFPNSTMENHLWGGMTFPYLLNKDYDERVFDIGKNSQKYFEDIENKIFNREFDLVIYGSFQRCKHMWKIVNKYMPKDRIILLDGEDSDKLAKEAYEGYLYFKRELRDYRNIPHNIKPITFSYPEEHLSKINVKKIKRIGTVIPGDKSTYIFKDEKSYYKDYNDSYFGITGKKAGWDCMRHYEIMGNYCIPFFPDINQCPKNTLYNFPKKLIIEGNKLIDNFNEEKYFEILDEMFKYFKNNLTTKNVAKKLMDRINENIL